MKFRILYTIFPAVLLFTMIAVAQPQPAAPNPALQQIQDTPGLPRVLLIGDSISIGYTLPVRELLSGKANVHRIPENGGNTNRGLEKLGAWLGDGKWDVIHFNWGLHDLRLDDGRQAVPLAQYEENLRALVRQLKATGAKLIWCSTTPVPEGDLNPPRRNADVIVYNEAAARVMRENGIPTDDLYAYANPILRELQLPANVHFKPEGSAMLAKQVVVSLEKALPSTARRQAGAEADARAMREREARTEWFRAAKFGLFIHWGLYAIPAGEWKGKPIAGIGEWIMNRAKIPVTEYELLAAQFNPVKFNAEEWVKLAKDAGMRYIVITSKHHDGFTLFKSAVSKYNVVDATPFKRDIIGELAAACKKHGMRLGFYYSQSQDWHEADGAGNNWDFPPNEEKDFDKYLRAKAEPQVREILTNYGPVALIWFDTPQMMTDERAGRFVEMVRQLQPNCLINGRLRADRFGFDYASMRDNQIPNQMTDGAWETPATLNDTWGFKKDDHNWKPPAEVIFKLVDIASKGGNYLLNVGPTAEGLIPLPSQDILRAVGRWLKVNGEAIYGAAPSPFGAEFGAFSATRKDPRGQPVFEAEKTWRATTKPGKLFIHLFTWPKELALAEVKEKVTKAYLLADPKRKSLKFSQAGGKLLVSLPETAPGEFATVVCLEIR